MFWLVLLPFSLLLSLFFSLSLSNLCLFQTFYLLSHSNFFIQLCICICVCLLVACVCRISPLFATFFMRLCARDNLFVSFWFESSSSGCSRTLILYLSMTSRKENLSLNKFQIQADKDFIFCFFFFFRNRSWSTKLKSKHNLIFPLYFFYKTFNYF